VGNALQCDGLERVGRAHVADQHEAFVAEDNSAWFDADAERNGCSTPCLRRFTFELGREIASFLVGGSSINDLALLRRCPENP